MTRTPAPSPMTKPSLPLSQGREAFSGSFDREDSALHGSCPINYHSLKDPATEPQCC